jgi:integrase
MTYKWFKTKYPGIRYREHSTRKHGVNFDRYYVIRYQYEGKAMEEALGWSSGGMDAERANAERSRLKEAARTGHGPRSLKEQREIENKRRKLEQEKITEKRRLETTFAQFFDDVYFLACKMDKTTQTARGEKLLFDNWISPVIGALRFDQIGIDHLDKIKENMQTGKRKASKPHPRDKSKAAQKAQDKRTPPRRLSNRYINYALAVVRQVWNRACASKPPLAFGDWPGASKSFKKPKIDNKRTRFLSKNESALLMQSLKKKSKDLHDMALLSLHCGLRAGEVFSLTWDKVNIKKGELLLVDTKNSESRISYLTDETITMLQKRSVSCEHPRFVFVTKIKGEVAPYYQVPVTFSRTVKDLGLNDGVTDSRDKIVFHSLRHTYASWLVDSGASLPIVRDLMGHKNLIMTSRYSHVSAEAQKKAVKALNQSIRATGENVVDMEEKRKGKK